MKVYLKWILPALVVCSSPLITQASIAADALDKPVVVPQPWISQQIDLGQGTVLPFYPQDVAVSLKQSTLPRTEKHYFPQGFQDGPKDNEISVSDKGVKLSAIDSLTILTPEFDAVSTFATARLTMNMWRETLETLQKTFPIPALQAAAKQWDSVPHGVLQVYPYGIPKEENAFYRRTETGCELRFGYFQPPRSSYMQLMSSAMIYTCRTSDIVAHETGHGALDRLRPTFFGSKNLQTGGLHEAFGDISALSFIFNNDTMVDALINSTKANLHASHNFAAQLAEQFGISLGMHGYLRNADNTYKLSDVQAEVHAISEVFTGAYYDALASAYKDASVQFKGRCEAATLLQDIGEYARSLFLHAVITVEKDEPDFSDVAARILLLTATYRTTSPVQVAYLKDLNWSQYFTTEFQRREITTPAANIRYAENLSALTIKAKHHGLSHCAGVK